MIFLKWRVNKTRVCGITIYIVILNFLCTECRAAKCSYLEPHPMPLANAEDRHKADGSTYDALYIMVSTNNGKSESSKLC